MNGWRILCPDGKDRHFPYINHGDAACDARVIMERGRCTDDEHPHGLCPDPSGKHEVVPCVYEMPKPPASA